MAFRIVKMPVLTPIPKASASTATIAKLGLLRSVRIE